MERIAHHSLRAQIAIAVFVVTLVLMGIGSGIGLWFSGRRADPSDDIARRILRNSMGPLAIQIAVRAIDLGFVKVLYTLFTPFEIGEYNFAGLLVTLIFATIADWGLTIWLTREVARSPDSLHQVFGTTLLLRTALALLMVPIAGVIVGLYGGFKQVGISSNGLSLQGILLIAILLPSLLPASFAGAVTAVFFAHEQPITPALANLLNNCVGTLLQLTFIALGWGIAGVAGAATLSTLLNSFLFAWLLVGYWGWPGLRWNPTLAWHMLRDALPLMLNGLLVAVFFRFDVLIIQGARTGGDEGVANYGAAYKFASLALVLPPIVINALFPLFARRAVNDRAGLLRGYHMTVRYLLLLALPLSAGLAALAPQAIALLASPRYVTAGAPALMLLIWFVPFSYINGVAQYVLIALQRQKTITWAFVTTALFNIIANFFAVPRWGIKAAAVVTVLSEIVLYLPFHVVLKRELGKAPYWELLWRPSCAAAVAGVTMFVLRRSLVGAVIAGILLYGAGLWLLGTMTDDDRGLVARLRSRAVSENAAAERG